MKSFVIGVGFFLAMFLAMIFTLSLYIRLVIAVKHNKDVPSWMYKLGKGMNITRKRGINSETGLARERDFTDKSALKDVHLYLFGVVISNIVLYYVFYGRCLQNDMVKVWLSAEFVIGLSMIMVYLRNLLLSSFSSKFRKNIYNQFYSTAASAVIGMFFISIVICMLSITLIGMPVKAPTVEVGNSKIVIGHTMANELLSNGFTFTGKTADDMIVNKRDSHIYYGETVELVKDGKSYGYVNVTPRYEDEARLKDCVITYFGISSQSETFVDIKICDKTISQLSLHDFENTDMKDIFSLTPISYREGKGYRQFSLRMQTYPHILWKSYTIETTFSDEYHANQFEVFAQHSLWE